MAAGSRTPGARRTRVQTRDYYLRPFEVNPFGMLSARFRRTATIGRNSEFDPANEAIKKKLDDVPDSRVSGVCHVEERRMIWIQKELTLPPYRRGFHLITPTVLTAVPTIQRIRTGILHVFLQHQ